MAFFVGSTSVYPGLIPRPTVTSIGSVMMNDGTSAYWAYPGEAHTVAGYGWRYRTLLTHGYIAAGYKGFNPWRGVNKTWHLTDTTIYCGEQIDRSGAYLAGSFSDINAYVHGTSNTWQGSATHTSSYNLFNGVMRMRNDSNFTFFGSGGAPYGYAGNNPVADGLSYGSGQASPNSTGGWDMSVARAAQDGASSTPGNGAAAGAGYIYGGGPAAVDKLNFPTEVMYTTTSLPNALGTIASVGGQTRSYVVGGSSNSYCWYCPWSTDTPTTWSFNGGYSDGNNKHLMSKYGWFYAGVYGNTNSTIWKFNDSTGAYISAMTKLGGFGEENQEMGQDWGYCMGNYNGQQNNWTIKTTYSTDSMATLGAGAQPKGHYGTSSGACSSAAASICSNQRA
jgi:hypothetical protein